MLELVKQKTVHCSTNDLNMWDLTVAPGVIWDDLNNYTKEINTDM